jgi:hypothetical protein
MHRTGILHLICFRHYDPSVQVQQDSSYSRATVSTWSASAPSHAVHWHCRPPRGPVARGSGRNGDHADPQRSDDNRTNGAYPTLQSAPITLHPGRLGASGRTHRAATSWRPIARCQRLRWQCSALQRHSSVTAPPADSPPEGAPKQPQQVIVADTSSCRATSPQANVGPRRGTISLEPTPGVSTTCKPTHVSSWNAASPMSWRRSS